MAVITKYEDGWHLDHTEAGEEDRIDIGGDVFNVDSGAAEILPTDHAAGNLPIGTEVTVELGKTAQDENGVWHTPWKLSLKYPESHA